MTDLTLAPQGRTELLVSGGGCACCAVDETTTTPDGRADAAASDRTATFAVSGMTCSNCVRHVTDEIAALDGVDAVDVDLVAGGVSTVTVRSGRVLDDAVIAAAVTEAGYEVVAR
jgi:copper chaperone